MKFQWYSKPLNKKKDNDWCITIPIDLNVIQFERNGYKIVIKNVQSFITLNE